MGTWQQLPDTVTLRSRPVVDCPPASWSRAHVGIKWLHHNRCRAVLAAIAKVQEVEVALSGLDASLVPRVDSFGRVLALMLDPVQSTALQVAKSI